MTDWPAYALVDAGTYRIDYDPALDVERFEDGFTRQRKRRSRALVRHRLTALVPNASRAAFQTWIKDTLNHGAAEFNFTPPGAANAVKARIEGGRVRWQAATTGEPMQWAVTLSLLVLEAA